MNAAKLLREIPEIRTKINEGTLTLTTLSQAQVHFKREDKFRKDRTRAEDSSSDSSTKQKSQKLAPVTSSEKLELLNQLENKPTREVEKILVNRASSPVVAVQEKVRALNENFSELRLVLDEETLKNLEKLRDIWSIDDGLSEVVKKMAKVCMEKVDPVKRAARNDKSKAVRATTPPDEAAQQKPIGRSRYIPAALRNEVWLRDGGGYPFEGVNGQKCGSRHRLQIDHIQPFALDGSHSLENLRLRCFTHNQLHALECGLTKAL